MLPGIGNEYILISSNSEDTPSPSRPKAGLPQLYTTPSELTAAQCSPLPEASNMIDG